MKSHWLVTLPGRPPFSMVGTPMTRAEATQYARGIWPEAQLS